MRLFLFARSWIPFAQAPDVGNAHQRSPDRAIGTGGASDATGSRFQPTPGIAAADVPKLKLKWHSRFRVL